MLTDRRCRLALGFAMASPLWSAQTSRASEVLLPPVADTYVTPGFQAGWDHGGARQLRVQRDGRVVYLKFNLPELSGPLGSATLVLSVIRSSTDGGTVYRVADTSWVEGTGTGLGPSDDGLRFIDVDLNGDSELDALDGSPLVPDPDAAIARLGTVRRGETWQVDVTAAFSDGPGLYTLAIASSGSEAAHYASSEYPDVTERPALVLAVEDGATSTTTTTLSTTSTSSTVVPTTSTSSSTSSSSTTASSASSSSTVTTSSSSTMPPAPTTPPTSTTSTTAVVVTTSTTTLPASGTAGTANVWRVAGASFDRYTSQPTLAQQAWMRDHYWRLLAYAPYFDTRLAWFPDAWAYKDLYAIYTGSALASTHPEWILRDGSGQALYIPYGCGSGTCPQYAGDPGNPDFRADWIAAARQIVNAGYRGLWLDDVNLLLSRVANGAGQAVVPIDPRTGQPMTEADWRRYVAEFTELIRRTFPDIEIVHNALWWIGDTDPSVMRQIAAADFQSLERGVNDGGIVRGGGTYGFDTFLHHLEVIHAAGRAFAFLGRGTDVAAQQYSLAVYLLMKEDRDGIAHGAGTTPDDWWGAGWDVDLGRALGPRYDWNGAWRRDFTDGFVLVNGPGAPARTLALGGAYADLTGAVQTSVVLGAAQGAVLLNQPTP